MVFSINLMLASVQQDLPEDAATTYNLQFLAVLIFRTELWGTC